MYLSIIIPCYNEERRIGPTLQAIQKYLSQKSFQSEVVVVDNGSTDRTSDIIEEFIGRIPNLRLVNRHSHGKGFAVRAGMLQATGDYRLFMDADNSTDVSQTDLLLQFVPEFDVVVSSRKIKGANIINPQPFYRVFLGNVFQWIVMIIVPVGVEDTQNGFKLFSKDAAEKILRHQTVFYWAFDVELLALARKFGYKIKEVPITWVNDDRSSMSLKGMTRMLFEVLSIRLRLWTSVFHK